MRMKIICFSVCMILLLQFSVYYRDAWATDPSEPAPGGLLIEAIGNSYFPGEYDLFETDIDIFEAQKNELTGFSNNRTLPPGEKDPFIAGLLSWFMMGIGQIYVHEYTKGSIFIAAGLANKAALILLISHINTKYAPSGDEIINIDWKSFDGSTRFLIVSYIAGTLGLRFYNVVDAVKSAQKYNERYHAQGEVSGISFKFEQNSFSFNYNYRFSD